MGRAAQSNGCRLSCVYVRLLARPQPAGSCLPLVLNFAAIMHHHALVENFAPNVSLPDGPTSCELFNSFCATGTEQANERLDALSRGRVLQSSGFYIKGYGSAAVLACVPGQHQKRLEHRKSYSYSEIVAVLSCLFQSDPDTRSSSPTFRCCSGAASATLARLPKFTRNFQGTRFRRCSRCSSTSMQLPPKLQPKKLGRCIAGSACSSAAANAASCLLLTVVASLNLPS